MACAQVDTDKIVVKTQAQYQDAIVAASSKLGFGPVCFSPFDGNEEYLRWVSESISPTPKGECPSTNAGGGGKTIRLITTTDSAGAAVKIMAAAKPVKSVAAMKQEQVTSYHMRKGELKHDAGECVWPLLLSDDANRREMKLWGLVA